MSTDQSINALVFLLLCARANLLLCPVAPFCLLVARAAWRFVAYLLQTTAFNTDQLRRCLLSPPRPSR